MTSRQNPAAMTAKPKAPAPASAKELKNVHVKQGTENAPEDTADRDSVFVRTAEGNDVEVNAEAQNTTQTLENRRTIDENPATKALRDQEDRLAMQGLVQNDALVNAAEQGRQQEYLVEKGLIDDPADDGNEHEQR